MNTIGIILVVIAVFLLLGLVASLVKAVARAILLLLVIILALLCFGRGQTQAPASETRTVLASEEVAP